MKNRLSRRDFLRLSSAGAAALATSGFPGLLGNVARAQDVQEITALWRTNPREIETMEEAFADFEAKFPNISVDFQQAPQGLEGEARLQSLFAAGDPPELFASVFAAGLVDYVYRDFVEDLKPLVDADELDLSDFFPVALETFTFGDKLYGLPRGGIPTPLFYNRDAFDEAGIPYPPTDWEDESWTWDVLLEYAKALTIGGGRRAERYGIVIGFESNFNLFNQFPMMWGTDIFPQEAFKYGITKEHNFRDPAVIESYQAFADLAFVHEVSPPPGTTTDLGFFGEFLQEQAAMYIQLGAYTVANAAEFNWSVAALPRSEASVQQRSTTFTGPFLMGRDSNTEAGWELIKYMTGEDGQRTIMKGAVVGTGRQSLQEEWLGQFNAPIEDLIASQEGGYKHGFESPNVRIAGWGEIGTLLREEWDPVFLGERTAQEASDSLSPKLDTLLQEIYDANVEKAREIFPDFPG